MSYVEENKILFTRISLVDIFAVMYQIKAGATCFVVGFWTDNLLKI